MMREHEKDRAAQPAGISQRAIGFARALVSESPSPELGEHAADFDWLIGGWSAVVRDYSDDGNVLESSGEWWFSWVLEGRAIQDVWIVPPRDQRKGQSPPNNRYGSTVRFFDNNDHVWRITWFNPVSGKKNDLAGRRDGDRIVLEGVDGSDRIRWSFNDITQDYFVWRGEHLTNEGDWELGAEFILTRLND